MYLNGKNVTTPQGICNSFSEFFQSVYVEDVVNPSVAFGVRRIVDIRCFTLSEPEVLKALKNIDITESDRPDDVCPLLVRKCAESLLSPLNRIFNLC